MNKITEALEKAKTLAERVAIINSIVENYEAIRSDSKAPTFLLQYLGTAFGLRLNCGFSMEEALSIEKNYHTLYVVSDEWLHTKLEEAADRGYAEVAYGLRVYCHSLTRSVLNSRYTPKIVSKHIRTIGNAMGQSYCQLTLDAGMKFLARVYEQGMQDKVRLACSIHDALYPVWVNDIQVTKWVNDNLIECMEDLDDLPELQSDIPIIADLEIFKPNWSKMVGLPKFGSINELERVIND